MLRMPVKRSMEQATLFTEQRWKILKRIAREPLSPLQLAQATGTSMANMSQQLRLLEAVGIVKKEKVPNRDRGKPRTLFSLAGDCAFMAILTGEVAEKKLVKLASDQAALLRIVFIEDAGNRKKAAGAYFRMRHNR